MTLGALVDPAREILSRARSLALGPRHPLERGEEVRPIFLVGSGRSGNTLARRILTAGGEVQIPPEMYALSEAIRVYRRNRTQPWPELVRATLSAFELDPGFAEFGFALWPLAARLERLAGEARSLAAILDALYRYHGERAGCASARWGDKTPQNAFHLDAVLRVFPRARFVHLLRDGVDVASSYVRAGLIPDLATAARRWRDAVVAVGRFAAAHPGACHELRYEDLVRAPQRVVPRLCAFLDLAYHPRMLTALPRVALRDLEGRPHHAAVLGPISERSVGAGRRGLSAAQRATLERVAGDQLLRLGYAPACAPGGRAAPPPRADAKS